MWRDTAFDPSLGQHGAGAWRADRAEVDRILSRERPRIEAILRQHLGPRQDLDDLVQTVFLELLRALPKFRGESTISTFAVGIAMMVVRRARRGTTWDQRKRSLDVAEEPSGPNLEDQAIAREQLRRLEGALARISVEKRSAYLLWALGGMSPEKIAEKTETSLSATRSRIFYAQKELKARAQKDVYLRELVAG